MWITLALIVGYALAIFTWPSLRLWLMSLGQHPTEVIADDIAKLKALGDKLRSRG